MKCLPSPLNDKNKLLMYLNMYENRAFKNGKSTSRNEKSSEGNIPIFESSGSELKAGFLREMKALKRLCEEGMTVERAICLIREHKGSLLFDRLSIESQELFILFMEREWGSSESKR